MSVEIPSPVEPRKRTPTQFFLKGLAISLPPILTLVILVWIGRGINEYIIQPTSLAVRYSIAQVIERPRLTDALAAMEGLPPLPFCGTNYKVTTGLQTRLQQRVRQGGVPRDELQSELRTILDAAIAEVYVPFGEEAVPYNDYVEVARRVRPAQMPTTAIGVYMELVTYRYFRGFFLLSAFAVSITVVLLYFIGRFVTARIGAWMVHKFETMVMGRVPVVSNVYSSVKQVTDFLFSERTIEYNRVVALEYPRRGIWSMGFVTGDSMLELTAAAGEPLVTVLVPTSPMPVTGYTMSVPRSEVLDLNLTIDQAFQFCISCGVLVPPHQRVTAELLKAEFTKRIASRMSELEKTGPRPRPTNDDDAGRVSP